ncbi:conserved protein of unknown function [Streptomyces sp. KY75]|nr:hypothetical protein STIB_28050 [Streptomyces sp. IB2014 011-1]CAD5928954.1 conserved protein of unknown function [Streptomyces sp. KY70]CAD5989383.1 conserved protein of unknown function [Streptomyces sp. KY75]
MHTDRSVAVRVPVMTTPQTTSGTFTPAQLGTQILIGWSSRQPDADQDTAYLLAYSLGDGQDGPEAGSNALRIALGRAGLQVGGPIQDAAEAPGIQAKLLVQAGQAVLTMPHLKAQYPAPAEWLAAALGQGQVYGMFATTPWPEAVPGQPVSEDQLRAFAADEEVVRSAAHCLLPVRSLG